MVVHIALLQEDLVNEGSASGLCHSCIIGRIMVVHIALLQEDLVNEGCASGLYQLDRNRWTCCVKDGHKLNSDVPFEVRIVQGDTLVHYFLVKAT